MYTYISLSLYIYIYICIDTHVYTLIYACRLGAGQLGELPEVPVLS